MQRVTQAWLVVGLTGSSAAFYLGMDSAASEAPILLFSLLGGVVADRQDRRRIIVVSMIVQALIAFLLVALIAAGSIRVWMVLAMSFLAGSAQAFSGPAYQSLIPSLVPRSDLSNAMALNSIQFNIARILGPIAAGVIIERFGMIPCFGINGISFLFIVVTILRLHDIDAVQSVGSSIIEQLKDGLGHILASAPLQRVTLLAFIGAFFGLPMFTLLPVIARGALQLDLELYVLLMTCAGAGAVSGGVIAAIRGQGWNIDSQLPRILVLFGVVTIAFASVSDHMLRSVSVFFASALLVIYFALTASQAQLLAPGHLRGRVMSMYAMAFRGGAPLGALACGWLATRFAAPSLIIVVNGLALTGIGVMLLMVNRRVALQHSSGSTTI